MFKTGTPESVGIKSADVQAFLQFLGRNGVNLHDILLMRGDTVFGEFYWKPFGRDVLHRQYSQTKSFVSVAIGLLVEAGKLSLSDPVWAYFPDKIDRELPSYMKEQTVRDMLTMQTCARSPKWFYTADPDRTHEYFSEATHVFRPSGTVWEYASPGSQVLASLVERLSGQTLFDFLYERVFVHLGTFRTATILKTPNGDSWGDSAMLCTGRDMLSFGRFVMNGGTWDGKRLINEAYMHEAVARHADNSLLGFRTYDGAGYGYQIWRYWNDCFSFNGMGGQYTVCCPGLDLVFVCNGDNQGFAGAGDLIFAGLEEFILMRMGQPLPADARAHAALQAYSETLTLSVSPGVPQSPAAHRISGQRYLCDGNSCGIKHFSFTFEGDTVYWDYTNGQGDKRLACGLGHNVFTKFPEEGYSDAYGGVRTTNGFLYDCAASAGWTEPEKLCVHVQIIDRYLGLMHAVFAFKGTLCQVRITRAAEAFLDEYSGEFTARLDLGDGTDTQT